MKLDVDSWDQICGASNVRFNMYIKEEASNSYLHELKLKANGHMHRKEQ